MPPPLFISPLFPSVSPAFVKQKAQKTSQIRLKTVSSFSQAFYVHDHVFFLLKLILWMGCFVVWIRKRRPSHSAVFFAATNKHYACLVPESCLHEHSPARSCNTSLLYPILIFSSQIALDFSGLLHFTSLLYSFSFSSFSCSKSLASSTSSPTAAGGFWEIVT